MFNIIDWSQPWYRSIHTAHEKSEDNPEWKAALNQLCELMQLQNESGMPIRFVEQSMLPAGVAYEAFIATTGQVPSRNNLHDYFNALMWVSFPSIKRQLNALQAQQIAQAQMSNGRGSARDAATIFDENATLLVMRDTAQGHALIEALRNHDWQMIFVQRRSEFIKHSDIWLFGHALIEKLVKPYKAITAHAWAVLAPDQYFLTEENLRRNWLDEHVASELQQCRIDGLHTARFMPLPVLGIPGWWPSQDQTFYGDATVFRARKPAK